ncbi:Serine/threonine kinase [Tulasnella sp. 419]|nr:Serine/threonine kinase [Tulasnella sp. 418]KAG8968752.1 Serine/threonine kinase [Tulasnella sp. 419]
MSAQEIDLKIQDVYKRIQAERGVIQASQRMRQATKNVEVQRTIDRKIREAEGSISYFQETLAQLQEKKAQIESGSSPMSPHNRGPQSDRSTSYGPDGGYRADPGGGRQSGGRDSTGRDRDSRDVIPKPKPYTNLDLLRADTPHTTAKVARTYHQLEFKLTVEQQYKKATDSMMKLYQAEGDKKILQDTKQKQLESNRKIQLLQAALKKYRHLLVLEEDVEEEPPAETTAGARIDNLRKPLSGTLHVTLREARDLERAPGGILKRSSKTGVETIAVLKIEGAARATSHPSRTDRWNEDFELTVDKANEVEIGIYDQQVGEYPVPIGFLWVKISDLAEALRKQKATEMAGGGWATANSLPSGHSSNVSPSGEFNPNAEAPLVPPSANYGPGGGGSSSEGITGWFSVEPVGAVLLTLNFVKENVRKRPLDAGLGRQGAVRKRKGEVHEMNGHKFVQNQFYQIMKCAYCGEFLLKGSGYQCEDCRYTCHKECYPKVVTKCISKSNAETEADEDKINHRIPHRFETITNMKPTWCCHCGSMLKLGRKNAKQCTECDITCHADCTHLVPDFCGMSMVAANELLSKIHAIKQQKGNRPPPPQHKPTPSRSHPSSLPSPPPVEQIESGMDRMEIGSDPYARSPPPQERAPAQRPGPPPSGAPRYDDRDSRDRYGVPQQSLPMTGRQQEQQMRDHHPREQQQPQQAYPSQQRRPPPPMFPEPSVGGRPTQSPYDRPGQPDAYDGRSMPPGPTAPPPPPKHDKQPAYSPQQPVPDRGPSSSSQLPPQQQQQVIPQQQKPSARRRKVGLDDFNFLAVLGKGNFGKVMLAEEKKSNGLYAIKVLKKEFIIDNDEVESTRSEKRVFLAAARERHPFLLGLHSCFQTETRIYFVMEYVSGGDLMLHIQRKQFSLRQAKFYAAEVLLALEYFHANGIIYRDLKLDNILLTLDGHVKVADYGLCKEEMWYGSTTSTFCGTPEFMAPEILLEQKYGRAVDWWAFGVLTYEMLLGQSPFRGDDEDEIFDAILEDEPLYPITMPRDAVSILQKLLTRDPARRLGSGKMDAEEIKRHAFFKDTNWDDVLNKRIPPPYYPTITSAADTSNFDTEFTREQPTLTPVHGQLSAQDQAEFNGFSWVASWADN